MAAAKKTTIGILVHLRGTSGGGSPDSETPAYVESVNGDGTVNTRQLSGTNTKSNVTYVEIGVIPPANDHDGIDYFQETISAS